MTTNYLPIIKQTTYPSRAEKQIVESDVKGDPFYYSIHFVGISLAVSLIVVFIVSIFKCFILAITCFIDDFKLTKKTKNEHSK